MNEMRWDEWDEMNEMRWDEMNEMRWDEMSELTMRRDGWDWWDEMQLNTGTGGDFVFNN